MARNIGKREETRPRTPYRSVDVARMVQSYGAEVACEVLQRLPLAVRWHFKRGLRKRHAS